MNSYRNDPTIDDHLGDLYFKTGNLQKAAGVLEEIRQHRNGSRKTSRRCAENWKCFRKRFANRSRAKVTDFARSASAHLPKMNLALSVLGRRPDGYHDIQTIFQTHRSLR